MPDVSPFVSSGSPNRPEDILKPYGVVPVAEDSRGVRTPGVRDAP